MRVGTSLIWDWALTRSCSANVSCHHSFITNLLQHLPRYPAPPSRDGVLMIAALPYRLAKAHRSATLQNIPSHFAPVGALIITARPIQSPTRHHQRRLSSSSSKPSSTVKDGSRLVQASEPHSQDNERPSSLRRKGRVGSSPAKIVDERFSKLPAVPSTQHLHPERMYYELITIEP
jgi:hypothetical protein